MERHEGHPRSIFDPLSRSFVRYKNDFVQNLGPLHPLKSERLLRMPPLLLTMD